MTPAAAKKFLQDQAIKYVLAQFVDIHGAAKAKAVPVEHLDMVLGDGAGFAGFALWGLGMGPHGPDYMARRRPRRRSRSMPWMPGYARIVCNGHVHGQALRVLLARGAASGSSTKLAARGLTMYTGIEPEFMLLTRDADGTLAPFDATDTLDKPCYDYKGLARASDVPRATGRLRCASVGIDVYQIDHEDANGQFEVNFTYADALTSADNFTFVQDGGLRDRAQARHDRHVHAQAVLEPHRQRRAFPHLARRREAQEPVPRRQATSGAWACRSWAITSSAAFSRMRARSPRCARPSSTRTSGWSWGARFRARPGRRRTSPTATTTARHGAHSRRAARAAAARSARAIRISPRRRCSPRASTASNASSIRASRTT